MALKLPDQDEIKKLPPDGGELYNRLVFEKSPYLLQHAANPVDWYPWGEEAFLHAKSQDKPVFLSIGYATCHWCHVMERESFEDPEVAELLNEYFVPIKVDREERPDIDRVYMEVCQSVTGSGGWPLTVLLTPQKKPFFAGTYFPKTSRFGRTGLRELIQKAADLWINNRGELLNSAEKITDSLQESSQMKRGKVDPDVVLQAFQQLNDRFDEVHGGFGSAPKFPAPHNLVFLLRFWKRSGEVRALEMVEKTLLKMRLGGIYDHVGFGFHRYSTDASWRLPHFEKMLYDQATLVMAYSEAYLATGKSEYEEIVRQILTYVLRDMTSPEGGFYSAEDADSEGKEGLFYLWRLDEFKGIAEDSGGDFFAKAFNLKDEGNFVDEATHQLSGRNLLYLNKPLDDLAQEGHLTPEQIHESWDKLREVLFEIREKRVHPLKDDKVLTDWNGLMVAALSMAGAALDEPIYIQAAEKAVNFIWKELRTEEGKLLKRFREGEAGLDAHLDDYAFLVWGLLELFQANFQTDHLLKAVELTEIMLLDFWDEDQGAFYFTARDQEDLIHRSKDLYDGAIPSGNSVAFCNLVRLSRLLLKPDYEEKARLIGEVFSTHINQIPQAYTQLMVGILEAEGDSCEVVISGDPESTDFKEMLRAVRSVYLPTKLVMLRPANPDENLFDLVPVLWDQIPLEGKATAYVCRNYQCSAPTTDIHEMISLLEAVGS